MMEAMSPSQAAGVVALPENTTADALHQERMEYIRQLVQEREALANSPGCDVARRLIEQELERVQSGKRSEEKRAVEVTKEKSIKVTVKVLVPVREHPKFNFVGKLLGPKGNSLKRLQEETMTKMAILGRGSFRDKAKEEELRKNPDPKYGHLQEDLHVEVTAHAPPAEAYARIAYALTEIRRYLVPDHNDEIRQEQMREMQVLNGRTGIAGEGGDTHTDTSGSLSPPNSLSPPPPAPVKLPAAQMAAAHAAAAVAPPVAHTLLTHPAMRGLTRAQMGLMTTVPNIAAPGVPGAMLGRFPTLLPLGSVAPLGQQAARSAHIYVNNPESVEYYKQASTACSNRIMPLYEDYTEVANLQTEYDPTSVVNGHSNGKRRKLDDDHIPQQTKISGISWFQC
ncbi:KH domain-containing, RNA-binding, signal transduction-associated protein 2-like isoform X3 [Macrobrachium nipponense]|uniref:KH domain-containing, RNA-binding, signal transduction-associated protein 2-like isoform X3 n=1 Tax=Macrobrachium nipponense TaxID=159736 RepID=UPI0030C7A485